MFDAGFSELLLVMLIALLVVGPERLPKLARSMGLWLGKIQRFMAMIKTEINHEIKTEELNQILNQQTQLNERNDLEEIIEESKHTISSNDKHKADQTNVKQAITKADTTTPMVSKPTVKS